MKLIENFPWRQIIRICMAAMIISTGHGQPTNREMTLSEELSESLSYFDQGHYNAAIERLIAHGKTYAAESGIAYYFVAESHYNLALTPQTSTDNRIQHLVSTIQFLNSAVENGLEESYPEKKDEVIYKRAWANFRLSELQCKPLEYLTRAYQDFDFIAGGSGDYDITAEGAYMAAESLIRKVLERRLQLFRSVNRGEQIAIVKEIRQDLRSAKEHLEDVTGSSVAPQYLQACAQFQIENIKVILAKTYAKLKPEVFEKARSGIQGANGREAAIHTLESLNYESVTSNLSQAMSVQFLPLIQYKKASAAVFEYLLTGEKMFEVNVSLDSLPKALYRPDYLFFQGNRDHKADIGEQRFIDLANTEASYYYEVSTVFPEALYWLGWVQYILNVKDSEEHFKAYLSKIPAESCDLRVGMLREDAQMRLFYLTFDKNAVRPGQLKSLKNALSQFKPTMPALQKERDLLLSLVRVGLREQAGDIFRNVDEVVELIRYVLPKAALVYGRERAQYLRYIDSLLKFTQYQKSEQTKFLQGIVTFLRAEIQPEDQDVLRYYKEAAALMADLEKGSSKYRHEARYIIARAYFNGAKHENDLNEKEKLYQKAKEIFTELVKNQKSLRSLFYLAEILTHEGNHMAAAECYQAVINATCRVDGGEFWCVGARAGLKNARNRGDIGVLQDIPIDRVQFPENLNKEDDEEITLEQFGYQKYVMKNQWAVSVDRLIQFGLPDRQLYPADNRLGGSRYALRDFGNQTADLSEQIIGLKSGLVLNVVLPEDLLASEQSVLVYYNGKLLPKEQAGYRVESIPLNEKALLEVKNDRCYVYRKNFRFTQPRQMNLIIPMIQKFRFRRIQHTPDMEKYLMMFPERLDRNALLISHDQISETSDLYQQLTKDLHFRDWDVAGDRILAVNDSLSHLLQYRLNGSAPSDNRDQTFSLDFSGTDLSLMTPEGVAVDSSDHIYITDVDQNRLFVFDSNGRFRSVLGHEKGTTENDTLPGVTFNRPKRIALAEDTDGIDIGEKRIYRPVLLFITDRNGIQVMNEDGNLLETIPNSEDQKGIFYDLMVTGYGKSSQIFVWNRKTGQVEWYKAEPVSN